MKNEQNHHINLLTDFGFKRFFGTEQYKNNLLHFLNTFLGPYIGTITDITYRPTEQLGFLPTEKRVVLDVLCTTQNDDQVIVEMQKTSQEFLKNRIVAYSSRLISNSLKVGDRKYNFPPVISVLLADFSIPELVNREEFMQRVILWGAGMDWLRWGRVYRGLVLQRHGTASSLSSSARVTITVP